VQREFAMKEHINRLNPIDIETYKISDYSNKVLSHIDRTLSSFKTSSRIAREETTQSDINIHQFLKKGSTNSYMIDESMKQKANSKVMEFFSQIKDVIKHLYFSIRIAKRFMSISLMMVNGNIQKRNCGRENRGY
jgi:hypothetical protein